MTPTDFLRLAVALIVLPVVIGVGRQLRGTPWLRFAAWTFAAVYLAFACTILEEYVAGELLNVLQHLSYGAAGGFALLTAVSMRAVMRQARAT